MKYMIDDLITGEIFMLSSKQDAIEEAERRVAVHNSNFYYRHRGQHYSENAEYIIEKNKIIIRRK